jgi:hypothetical protein
VGLIARRADQLAALAGEVTQAGGSAAFARAQPMPLDAPVMTAT